MCTAIHSSVSFTFVTVWDFNRNCFLIKVSISTSAVPPRRVLANHNEEYERPGVLLNCPSTAIPLILQAFNAHHSFGIGAENLEVVAVPDVVMPKPQSVTLSHQ